MAANSQLVKEDFNVRRKATAVTKGSSRIPAKLLQALGGNAREAQWPQRLREVHRAAHRLRRVHTRPQACARVSRAASVRCSSLFISFQR